MIGIDAIWLLNLVYSLMRSKASFLRYTGYLNFIKYPISNDLLLFLAHVLLPSCLYFLLFALLRLKAILYNIVKQFIRGIVNMEQLYFGLLKTQVRFLLN